MGHPVRLKKFYAKKNLIHLSLPLNFHFHKRVEGRVRAVLKIDFLVWIEKTYMYKESTVDTHYTYIKNVSQVHSV